MKRMDIQFQVADVKRPLLAVKRLVEKGNRAAFSSGENYIENVNTGARLKMWEKGHGSYVLKVNFVGGGAAEITVDSAAEESVCPKEWGAQFGLKPADEWMKFASASGGAIQRYGQRLVKVEAGF